MKNQAVVILIDALGFDLAERYGMHPKGLHVRVRLETVLGFSQAALTSIVTGLRPDEHGLWMMYSFAASGTPFGWMKVIPKSVSAERLWLKRLIRWKLESVDDVKSYYSLYCIPREIFPYLDLPARSSLFVPGGAGTVPSVFDEMERRNIRRFIRDYRTPEAIAFDDLERAIIKREARFYLLYTAGLDALLHRYGSGDERVAERLEWYRGRVERIIETIEATGGETDVFVLGDHGMCDIASHVDVISAVNSLGLKIPDDYVPFYDSTMARFKIMSDHVEDDLRKALSGVGGGNVLTAEELGRLGVFFPDGRFGDLIFLTDPGTIILPSYMSEHTVAAMHGYHPDTSCMASVMYTNRESVENELSICDCADILLPGFGTRVNGAGHDG